MEKADYAVVTTLDLPGTQRKQCTVLFSGLICSRRNEAHKLLRPVCISLEKGKDSKGCLFSLIRVSRRPILIPKTRKDKLMIKIGPLIASKIATGSKEAPRKCGEIHGSSQVGFVIPVSHKC